MIGNSTRAMLEHSTAVLKLDLRNVYRYFDDPNVQEIMINSADSIWIEQAGQLIKTPETLDTDILASVVTQIANINGKSSSDSKLIDARLPGLRIAATLPPIAGDSASMSIRRHSSVVRDLNAYLKQGAFSAQWPQNKDRARVTHTRPTDEQVGQGNEYVIQLLEWIIATRKNIAVTGSTSSGKTSLLNAIALLIEPEHRVLTIEDTLELMLSVPNLVRFEANQNYQVNIRALVRHALRYRPTRILVGEIRGAEAFDMLDAYNTGHPGSMVSFHSDDATSALHRLENMVRMAPEAANWPLDDLRRQIAITFPFVIHQSLYEGMRGLNEIIEVQGVSSGSYITKTLFKKTNPF